jgi:hypothetical protein
MNPIKQTPLSTFQSVIFGTLFGVVFAAIGYIANQKFPTIQPEFLKTTCVLIGVIWAFCIHVYNKLFELTDLSGITGRQHERLETVVHDRLKHFWLKAFIIGALGLIAMFPSISKEADGSNCITACVSSPIQIYCAYAAIGVAILMLIRLLIAQEEIRRTCSMIKKNEREEAEVEKRLSELNQT